MKAIMVMFDTLEPAYAAGTDTAWPQLLRLCTAEGRPDIIARLSRSETVISRNRA